MAFKYVTENDLSFHMRPEKRTELASTEIWEGVEGSVIEFAVTNLRGQYDTDSIFFPPDGTNVYYNPDLAYIIAGEMVYRLVKGKAPNWLSEAMQTQHEDGEEWLKRAGLPLDSKEGHPINPRLPVRETKETIQIKSDMKYRSERL